MGLALKDSDDKITAANDAILAMFQLSKEEMLGSSLSERLASSFVRLHRGQRIEMVNGDLDKFEFERPYVRPDGTEFVVKGLEVAVRDENHQFLYTIVGLEDVTERP